MPSQENIQIVQRWFREVWNEGKTETVRELLAPDGVTRGQNGSGSELRGPAQFVSFVERWSATMTHTGDGLGIPATGKLVRSTGISIAQIVNGQVVEGWDNWDQLGMLQQIGAYQPPELVTLPKTA